MKSLLIGTGIVILLMIGATRIPPPDLEAVDRFLTRTNPFRSQRTSAERSPSTSLKTISSAQAYFRANGLDGNGVNQFWKGDIAGLYALLPRNSPDPIKLIELSVAAADEFPVTTISRYSVMAPKAGYWFRALRHADEKIPDPQRFAACCYPADYPRGGRWTFVVDENNTIFRRDLGHGRGPAAFPTDEEIRTQWVKLD